MQGLDIAKLYYEQYGKPAIKENFPELEDKIAVGLVGSGSECFGFDDEISHDHDFEPGFCMWITDEIDSRTAFKLERLYAKLPKEFMGLKRGMIAPAGGSRHGVIKISDFLERHIGRKDAELDLYDWFYLSEASLSEVVNGAIWKDDEGTFTKVRETLSMMPEDIRLKKLAGSLYLMGQSGNYNYPRCLAHGEVGAAQLAVCEFVKHTMHVIFLLNNQYMPYYKWSFKALSKLELLANLKESLEYLLNTGNNDDEIEKKKFIIQECIVEVIETLQDLNLTTASCTDLGNHSASVNDKIKDVNIRNADILAAINTTI